MNLHLLATVDLQDHLDKGMIRGLMDDAWKDFLVQPAGRSFRSCLHPIGVKAHHLLLKLLGNLESHLDNCTKMPFWLKCKEEGNL